MKYVRIASTLLVAVFVSSCATNVYPVYLTWQGDTSTTMTVNFHTSEAPDTTTVYYDTEPREGLVTAYRYRAEGETRSLQGLPEPRFVNSVELRDLEPGTLYYFVAGDSASGLSEEHRFRTVPRDGSPLRFIVGGDMSVLPREKLLLREAAEFNPMFMVIGGDLAYANGNLDSYYIWDIWLKRWYQLMVTDDGALVPMVLGIGNHETNDLEGPQEVRAPFYFTYFPQGGKSYFSRTFGNQVGMVMLDTDHIVPCADQNGWLDEQLAGFAKLPVTMAIYHVPMYPSVRDYDGELATRVREEWLSIFDAHELTVGFEHHDHALKRSKLLRGGKVAENGTLYLGDGAFGVKTREVTTPLPWYLERASRTPHFCVVDVEQKQVRYRAINSSGEVVDETQQALKN